MSKKRDDEKFWVVAICGLFTVALLIVDFTASNVLHMQMWLTVLEIVAHAFVGYCWYRLLIGIEDPNQDYWRKLCIATAVAALIGIMADRSTMVGKKMFEQTVEETKNR